jgi:nucleoside-diphosphate-sugar epimerase
VEGFRQLAPDAAPAHPCGGLREPVAITGATGFIGYHLVSTLQRAGVRPRALVRDPGRLGELAARPLEVVRGDLGDHTALRRLVAGAGTVIHLAGLVRAGRASDFDLANRVGTENLVSAMAKEGAALVCVSSLAAAGPSPMPAGLDPTDQPRPISCYGRSKLAGELAVSSYPGAWAILRPPAVYGPRDIDVLQFFRLVARGLVPVPRGERWVTVAFVGDVVRAVLAAAGDPRRAVYHLGDPEPRTLAGLLAELAAAGGVRARVVPVPALVLRCAGVAGDALQAFGVRSAALTSDKARELLARHWTAQTAGSLRSLGLPGYVPFGAGAAATWAWYRQAGWLPRATIPAA